MYKSHRLSRYGKRQQNCELSVRFARLSIRVVRFPETEQRRQRSALSRKIRFIAEKEPRQLLRRRQRMQFRRIRNFKMEKRQTAKTGKRHSNRQIFRLFPRLSDRQKVLNLKSPRRRRVGGFLFDFILRYPRSRCRTAGICRKILAAGFRRTGISPYMSAKKCRSDFG